MLRAFQITTVSLVLWINVISEIGATTEEQLDLIRTSVADDVLQQPASTDQSNLFFILLSTCSASVTNDVAVDDGNCHAGALSSWRNITLLQLPQLQTA